MRPNHQNNGVLQGKFCIFTCPKVWHFSWKMNIRMGAKNLTFLSPGSRFFYSTVNFLFLCMLLNDAQRELQKRFDFERRTVQKIAF